MSEFVFTGAESYLLFNCNINFKFSICSPRLTCGKGIFYAVIKKISRHKMVFAYASSGKYFILHSYFLNAVEHSFLSLTRPLGVEQTETEGDIQIKKRRTMKTNFNISTGRGRTSTSGFNQIKKVVKVVAIIIGSTIGLVLWVFLKPILRGAGWVLSILSALAIIYWILTNL